MEDLKKYKILRIVTVIQSAIILAAVIFIMLSGVLENKDEYLLTKSDSDNGNYTISVYEVGKPNIFRTNEVKAYYSDVDHKKGSAVFTAEVNNGKEMLTKDNFVLSWEGDTAVLYLEGANQTGTSYKINFDTVNKK